MEFISYSQNFEDVMLWRALKDIEGGFYVDVGANDPVFDSVTQAFYERGWRGINIEPMRSYYDKLCSKRTFDINLPFAVGESEGELTLYEIPGTGLSTIDKEIAQKQRDGGWDVSEQVVKVTTLNSIFEQHVKGPIHFLKIDVEGAEEIVLRGIDLVHWRPWILIVEATVPLSSESNFSSWESRILKSGYEFVYFDGLNRFYVSNEHSTLAQAFNTPPNIFDNFMRNREVAGLTEQIKLKNDHIKELINTVSILEQQKMDLQNVIGQIYQSHSWRITFPLRKTTDIMRELSWKIRALFPLSTLPGRAIRKILRVVSLRFIIPLSENKTARAIGNRLPLIKGVLKRLAYGPQQAPHLLSLSDSNYPISFPAMKIYFDLLNQINKHEQKN